MTPETVALFLVGALQAFIQEGVIGNRLNGTAAHYFTLTFSFALALVAVWVTGGFAGVNFPVFSAVDPSPLLGFLIAKMAPVYLLSQTVFATFNGTVRKVGGTS